MSSSSLPHLRSRRAARIAIEERARKGELDGSELSNLRRVELRSLAWSLPLLVVVAYSVLLTSDWRGLTGAAALPLAVIMMLVFWRAQAAVGYLRVVRASRGPPLPHISEVIDRLGDRPFCVYLRRFYGENSSHFAEVTTFFGSMNAKGAYLERHLRSACHRRGLELVALIPPSQRVALRTAATEGIAGPEWQSYVRLLARYATAITIAEAPRDIEELTFDVEDSMFGRNAGFVWEVGHADSASLGPKTAILTSYRPEPMPVHGAAFVKTPKVGLSFTPCWTFIGGYFAAMIALWFISPLFLTLAILLSFVWGIIGPYVRRGVFSIHLHRWLKRVTSRPRGAAEGTTSTSLADAAATLAEAASLVTRGEREEEEGNLDEALRTFEEAAQMWPDLAPAWWGIESCALVLDEREQRAAALGKLVDLVPDGHARMGLSLTHALRDSDQPEKALSYVEQLAEANVAGDSINSILGNPLSAQLALGRAELLSMFGRDDEVVDILTEELGRDQELSDEVAHILLLTRAWAFEDLGRLKLARKDYEQAIATGEATAMTMEFYGDLLRDEGKFRKALAAYDRAVQLSDEDDADLLVKRGDVLLELGRAKKAAKSYRRALRAEPDHDQARERLRKTD